MRAAVPWWFYPLPSFGLTPEMAVSRFEDTLAFCRKTGCRTGLARSQLDDSLAISSVLGKRLVRERMRSRHLMLGAQWPNDRP